MSDTSTSLKDEIPITVINTVQEKFEYALALHQAGDLATAKLCYEDILELQPKHADALHLLGVLALQVQDYHRAIHFIESAIAVLPNNAIFHSNQGVALDALKQFQAALASYDRAVSIDPNYAEAYCNRGSVLYEMNQLEAAIHNYDQAIAIKPDYAQAHHNRGCALYNLKRLDAAIASFDQAISIDPHDADAYCNRGNVLAELKQPEAALISYDQAITLQPNHVPAHVNRGNLLNNMNEQEAALVSYDRAIAIQPDCVDAHYQKGNVLCRLKQFEAACQSYDRVIALKPESADVHCNRGVVLCELNRLEDAVASYSQAIAIKPDHAEAYYNRGRALAELNKQEEAVASYDQFLALRPDSAEVYCRRGIALHEINQLEAALASHDQAIAIQPDYADAHFNRGSVLHKLKQLPAAIASYDRAIAIEPRHVNAYSNRGNALSELKQMDAAIASYDQAIAIQPDHAAALMNKSIALLLNGDFENGWALYEWRWKVEENKQFQQQFTQPLWLGEQSLEGKTILLHSEQGFGDTIQFCRYVPLVAQQGASVVLGVSSVLASLLTGLKGVSQLIKTGDTLPNFDYHCPLLSLPLACKSRLNNIPSAHSYLHVDMQKKVTWARRLGKKNRPRVGLAWRGRSYKSMYNRGLGLSMLLQYLPDQYDYVCLQKEISDTDRTTFMTTRKEIEFFDQELTDFSDTAALCDLVDLVISVDTSVAHLAAALGKQTWILLPFVPDWRWLLDRDDSPWYPTVRLYRQPAYDDWQGALKKLHADLLNKWPVKADK